MSFSPWLPRAVLKQKCRSLAKSGANHFKNFKCKICSPLHFWTNLSTSFRRLGSRTWTGHFKPFSGLAAKLMRESSEHKPTNWNMFEHVELTLGMTWKGWKDGKDMEWLRFEKRSFWAISSESSVCTTSFNIKVFRIICRRVLCCSRALGGFRHSQTHLCLQHVALN